MFVLAELKAFVLGMAQGNGLVDGYFGSLCSTGYASLWAMLTIILPLYDVKKLGNSFGLRTCAIQKNTQGRLTVGTISLICQGINYSEIVSGLQDNNVLSARRH
jgi:hypothetical protein